MRKKISVLFSLLILLSSMPGCAPSYLPIQKTEFELARNRYELNSGWVCTNIENVRSTGEELSTPGYPLSGWTPATVPGTVLTTMLNDGLIPDPFYGMNDRKIPGHL